MVEGFDWIEFSLMRNMGLSDLDTTDCKVGYRT